MTSIPADASGNLRRHDLDALRAIAMLLGILLHGALSFIPGGFWPVQDTRTNGWFGMLMAAVHGFRMPLFFLLSGFFTMMLLRRRGLLSVLWHRFRRIFVPLVLGTCLLVPANALVNGYVQTEATPIEAPESPSDIHAAAAWGNVDAIDEFLEAGVSPDLRAGDGATPVLIAAFFGRPEAVRKLLDAGADPSLRKPDGVGPMEAMAADYGTTKFIGKLINVSIPPERELWQHRGEIKKILLAHPKLNKSESTPSTESDGEQRLEPESEAKKTDAAAKTSAFRRMMHAPILGHLWFLWFLCLLVAATTLMWPLLNRFDGRSENARRRIRRFIVSPMAWFWFVPLTAWLQHLQPSMGAFGPATTVSIAPNLPLIAYYGVFFGFGMLYWDCHDETSSAESRRLGSWWPLLIGVSVSLLFPVGMALTGNPSTRWISSLAQSGYAWAMSFAGIGLFRTFFSKRLPTVRYLSDSSYFLYVAHLPLIMLPQFWIRQWPLPSALKWALVCVGTTAFLLLVYQVAVRHTPIGWLLNGRRKPATSEAAPATVTPATQVV